MPFWGTFYLPFTFSLEDVNLLRCIFRFEGRVLREQPLLCYCSVATSVKIRIQYVRLFMAGT